MPKFYGKNSIKSTRALAGTRVKYNSQAFGEDYPQVVDFNFAERTLYGRVDRSLTPVVPKLERLQVAESNDASSTVVLMNFVADQFRDFTAHFSNAIRMGVLPNDDPIFSNIQARRGYEDPEDLYDSYVDEIFGLYSNQFLTKYAQHINSFDDYLEYFPQFMKIMRDGSPVTYSGFQKSNNSSIFTSGLAVDIAGLSFSSDLPKEELILNSTCFRFYLNLAKQYGFSVNKRNPGVLISDLQSPGTAPYRAKIGLPSIDVIFRQQFQRTLYEDLPKLTQLLLKGYNSFVTSNYLKRTFTVCEAKLSSTVTPRQYLTMNNIEGIYNNKIINLYIHVRNIEERNPFNKTRITDMQKNAVLINKESEGKMLRFIDDQFRSKYNLKDGSLTYYNKKFQKKLDSEP